jgi:gliding motility-associated-like protein
MKYQFFKTIVYFFLLVSHEMLYSQVTNDDCETATFIPDARDYCSAFRNDGATQTNFLTNCFTGNGRDVWFSFRAIALEINLSVIGYGISSNGTATFYTLRNANVALSSGECGTLDERYCKAVNSAGNAEIVVSGLVVGEIYHVRVWGANNTTGTFQLCIKNYNPPSSIDSDCPTAAVLCDKSPFTVARLSGAGRNATELNDATCFERSPGGLNNEQKSVWFKWTCQTSGTLTFKITPLYIGDGVTTLGDDIDFALYELPNGLNECAGKRLLRCMAAGPHPNTLTSPGYTPAAFQAARRCRGATGLNETSNLIAERPGCEISDPHTNFVRQLDMEAGKTYALGINNYGENNGDGFSIEFGGTGTFVGPQAKINFSDADKKICIGEEITYTDASSFSNGSIVKRAWKFGKDASIDSSTADVPHRVFYKSPGWKSVVLTVTTDRGCQVTTILDSIFVKPFQYDSLVRQPTCTGGNDGMIRLRVRECGKPPYLYNWDNTGFTTRDSLSNIPKGTYRVAVTDSSRVYIDTFVFRVSPLEIQLDTAVPAVKQPSCFGFMNGAISLRPANGRAPFEYNWGRGWTLDSTYAALGEGSYSVQVRDANDCKGNFTFDVTAPPRLQVGVDTINITCFGRTDGRAIARPSGGVGGYRVNWSNGALGDTAVNLRKGNYNVTVFDKNDCPASNSVFINEPPQILLTPARIRDAKCYGDSTGELVIRGGGGTPPYRYSIDGVRFQTDTFFRNIPARKYNVVVRDSTGCKASFDVTVGQPPQLQVNAGPDLDIDLGYSATIRAIVIPSTKPVSYIWTPQDSSLSCKNCPNITVSPIQSTLYRVQVRDSTSCTAFDEVLIRILKRRPIYIPNVFTPNGDGVNDWFTVFGNQAAVRVKSLRVFNRWGGLMYEGFDLPLNAERLGWDGTFNKKELDPDVFVYMAVVQFIDGEEVLFKGDVTILR